MYEISYRNEVGCRNRDFSIGYYQVTPATSAEGQANRVDPVRHLARRPTDCQPHYFSGLDPYGLI